MSGHVFHPGHSELHGITVVVETAGALWVGRFHEVTPKGILLHDAGRHEDSGAETRQEFLRKVLKFGIRQTHRNAVIPEADVVRISKLGERLGS
jgi:hypothetical protein